MSVEASARISQVPLIKILEGSAFVAFAALYLRVMLSISVASGHLQQTDRDASLMRLAFLHK